MKYPKWPIYATSVKKTELSNLTENGIVLPQKHGAPHPHTHSYFSKKSGVFWTKRAKNGWMLFVKIVALCCYNLLNWSVLETYWILLVFFLIGGHTKENVVSK